MGHTQWPHHWRWLPVQLNVSNLAAVGDVHVRRDNGIRVVSSVRPIESF